MKNKKVSYSDIIQDPNIFNRLTNKKFDLKSFKKLFDRKAFKYIESEIERLTAKDLPCTKCKKILNGTQIMCHGCLDWFHAKCTTIKTNEEYFCSSCK